MEPGAAGSVTPSVNITGAAATSTGPAFSFNSRGNGGMVHIVWDITSFFQNNWQNGDTLTAAGLCSGADVCDETYAELNVTYNYPNSEITGIKTVRWFEMQDISQNSAGVAATGTFSTFIPETPVTFRNGGSVATFLATNINANMDQTLTIDSAEVTGTDTLTTTANNPNIEEHPHQILLTHSPGGQFTSSSQSNISVSLNHTGSAYIARSIGYSSYEYPIPQPPGNPQMRAAADQTFTFGDGITAISAITVTSTAASQITAANDIRIVIATGTTNFLWDTSDTLATITGSASGNASTTVSYENGSSTLVIDVTGDFANNTGITISGLGYRDFNAVNSATSTRDLKWNGQGQAPPFVRDTRTAAIRGRLQLEAHSAGQESDKFAASSTYANQELFAFQLLPNDEAASTTLTIDLSAITGIITGDIASPQIFVDANANGTVDAGETTTAFGAGTVSISGGTGTITFTATTSTLASATSTRYILKATSTNLLAGDTITFSLATSSVAADGQTSKVRLGPTLSGGGPTNGVHTVDAVSRAQRSFRWQNDDGANVNSNSASAAADTALSSVRIPQRLALRMQIDNDGGGEGAGIAYKLQFQANATSGAWIDVANGNAIQASQGLAGADAAAITSAVAAANSRTFVNGTWHEGTGISAGTSVLTNSRYTELAYMIETSLAASSTTYYFRVVNNSDGLPINSYSVFPSFTTLADSNQLIQYSKNNVSSLGTGTSSLTFYFDDIDYSRASSSDNLYSTSTSAANKPVFNFRVRNSTSSYPLRINWEGQYSAASTTSVDAFRFGSTNAWQTLVSTSSPAINTDFTLTANLTTSTSEYYQADGANFWTYFRVYQATSTSNLRTDFVNVEFVPTSKSTADQTLQVNDGATAISSLTVKTTRTPVITAANDIRIKIPSSLNMLWQTSTVVATIGGSASGKASTTVSYPDNKTLLINVLTDFAADDDLTISGLNFSNFTSASASTTLETYYDGASDAGIDALDSQIKQIRGKHDVNAHAAGQEINKLDISNTSITAAEFLAFQLVPTGENATTSQVVIDLFDTAGFVAANITNAVLRIDSDGNGAIGAGETTEIGGAGSVSLGGGTGSITFSTSFSNTSTLNIILRADLASVDPEDIIKFRVQPSSITSTGQTSKISLAPSGSTLSAAHSRPSKKHGGATLIEGGGPPAVANLGGGSQGGGGSSEGGSGGGGSQGGGGQGGGGAAP
ncbi:MAG: hypothetical protein HYW34_03770 [Candidatus Brennerbacteria bacterium]|nr:hypothetical protein [Candidatus Brennerbacteria bacterium]